MIRNEGNMQGNVSGVVGSDAVRPKRRTSKKPTRMISLTKFKPNIRRMSRRNMAPKFEIKRDTKGACRSQQQRRMGHDKILFASRTSC